MRSPSFLVQILGVFAFALAGGLALQAAGMMPRLGNPAPPAIGTAPPQRAVEAPPPRPAPPALRTEPLVGDGDTARDTMRRAVVVTARELLTNPCDLDRRAAFQMSLRDYARLFAAAPRRAEGRDGFRTSLDAEAARATGVVYRSGLLDAGLVGRWRSGERDAVEDMLRRERLSLETPHPDTCAPDQRTMTPGRGLRI